MTLTESYQEGETREERARVPTSEMCFQGARDLLQSGDDDSSIESLFAPLPGFNFLAVPHNKRAVSAVMFVKEEHIDEVAAQLSVALEDEKSYLVLRKPGYFCFMLNLTFNKIAALLALYLTHESYLLVERVKDLLVQ